MSRGVVGRTESARKQSGEIAAERPARERILAAAFAAFTELGYAQASTLEIATRARVSKRELYALFGSKQQMLIACISVRAQRMRLPADWPALRHRADLDKALAEFGAVLLREISDPDVIAVFRLAIAEADRSPEVAQALDTFGRQASLTALRGLLEQAQSAGFVDGSDLGRMATQFIGLLWEDLMVCLMLGIAARPDPGEIRRRARVAAHAFFKLHPERAADSPSPAPGAAEGS
jgi:AcrR family transcriptional regulator